MMAERSIDSTRLFCKDWKIVGELSINIRNNSLQEPLLRRCGLQGLPEWPFFQHQEGLLTTTKVRGDVVSEGVSRTTGLDFVRRESTGKSHFGTSRT